MDKKTMDEIKKNVELIKRISRKQLSKINIEMSEADQEQLDRPIKINVTQQGS